MSTPRASVFRLAAVLQHQRMLSCYMGSQYSCDNIMTAAETINVRRAPADEREYYQHHFKPRKNEECGDLFAWWPKLPFGQWDHESRILALLLSAEMIRNP